MNIYQTPIKTDSRNFLIKYYNEITGLHNIPHHQNYITLCADDASYEYEQLVLKKFIFGTQFLGINRDPEIIKTNQNIFTHCKFYYGDFIETLRTLRNKNELNPGLINCDLTEGPEKGINTVLSLMSVTKQLQKIVCGVNVMLNNPRRPTWNKPKEYWINKVEQNLFSNWKIFQNGFEYYNVHTQMCTLMLYRGY